MNSSQQKTFNNWYQVFIENLLQFPWLIEGDDTERDIVKKHGDPHQQELYAYLCMEKLLQ